MRALVFATLLLAPRLGQACSVCFSATDENRIAFIATTAFMTGLPLLLIGSVVGWLWWRVAQLRRAADERSAPQPSRAEPARRDQPPLRA